MDVNHLILNMLSQSITKIDATGAITVLAFDTSLAHTSSTPFQPGLQHLAHQTLLFTPPMWYTIST
jgi:hypothetical protein